MPKKLSLEEERALVKLMTQGKEAHRKLEADKGKLTEDERKELLALVEQGERARKELILAHIGLAHAIASALCKKYGCWDLREELISDGYFKLIETVDKFEPEKGYRAATYAYKRIWGAMMNLLVKERFAPPVEYESLDSSQSESDDNPALNLEEEAIRRERSELLLRAINELPEKYREVIVLQLSDELSDEEIAGRLVKPIGTVKSLLHRARKQLCAYLGPLCATQGMFLNGGEENA